MALEEWRDEPSKTEPVILPDKDKLSLKEDDIIDVSKTAYEKGMNDAFMAITFLIKVGHSPRSIEKFIKRHYKPSRSS